MPARSARQARAARLAWAYKHGKLPKRVKMRKSIEQMSKMSDEYLKDFMHESEDIDVSKITPEEVDSLLVSLGSLLFYGFGDKTNATANQIVKNSPYYKNIVNEFKNILQGLDLTNYESTELQKLSPEELTKLYDSLDFLIDKYDIEDVIKEGLGDETIKEQLGNEIDELGDFFLRPKEIKIGQLDSDTQTQKYQNLNPDPGLNFSGSTSMRSHSPGSVLEQTTTGCMAVADMPVQNNLKDMKEGETDEKQTTKKKLKKIIDKAYDEYRAGRSKEEFKHWLINNPVGLTFFNQIKKLKI